MRYRYTPFEAHNDLQTCEAWEAISTQETASGALSLPLAKIHL